MDAPGDADSVAAHGDRVDCVTTDPADQDGTTTGPVAEITVDDGVWVIDLGDDPEPTPPARSARAAGRSRSATPITAHGAEVPKSAARDQVGLLVDLAAFDAETVKDEALSWLKALTHAA